MKRICVLTAMALLIALSSGKMVTAAPATPVPEMQANWTPWAFEIGTWVCHGTVTGRPGDRMETDVNSMAFDNHWMVTKFDSPPFDPKRTKHSIGVNYLSWDADNHLWYGWGADNFGGANGYGTSPGWSGDTITTTFYTMKNGSWTNMGRQVTTKVSDAMLRDVTYDQNGQLAFKDVCKKQM